MDLRTPAWTWILYCSQSSEFGKRSIGEYSLLLLSTPWLYYFIWNSTMTFQGDGVGWLCHPWSWGTIQSFNTVMRKNLIPMGKMILLFCYILNLAAGTWSREASIACQNYQFFFFFWQVRNMTRLKLHWSTNQLQEFFITT